MIIKVYRATMSELKMYIFVNSDLGMSAGKIASQVGHVVQTIIESVVRSGYESSIPTEAYINYRKWSASPTKVVLKASTQQLLELTKKPFMMYIMDSNTTQVPDNSLTALGFYPGMLSEEDVKDYKLL